MATAATTATSSSTTAQNPNPFNLNLNNLNLNNLNLNNLNLSLPPWLRGPFTFISPPLPPLLSLLPSPPPPPEPVTASTRSSRLLPGLRVTTEYESEEGLFTNKVSCKLAGGLAKLRLSFQSDPQGQGIFGEDPAQQLFAAPLVGFITKHFSVLYDVEERNTLLNGDASLPGGAVQLHSSLDVKVSL
jgi:hypothetical protein